jgi:hypothetical protein
MRFHMTYLFPSVVEEVPDPSGSSLSDVHCACRASINDDGRASAVWNDLQTRSLRSARKMRENFVSGSISRELCEIKYSVMQYAVAPAAESLQPYGWVPFNFL